MDPQTLIITAILGNPMTHMAFGALVGAFIHWVLQYDPDIKPIAVRVDSYALALKALDEKLMAAVPGSPVLVEADALLTEIDGWLKAQGIQGDASTVTVESFLTDLGSVKAKLAGIAAPTPPTT